MTHLQQDKIHIAVLVSGGGTNLQALIDAQASGILQSGTLSLVISNKPDAFALTRAKKAGIPSAVVPKAVYGYEGMENRIIELLTEYQIDLIVLAGFMSILSPAFVERYDHRILNIHPSLIPAFCGAGFYGLHVHEAALARGVKLTGATVHFVNEIPDGGEIVLQKAVRVNKNDTPESLQKRVMRQAEWKILPKAVEQVAAALKKQKNRSVTL